MGRLVDDNALRSPRVEGRTALYLTILSFLASGILAELILGTLLPSPLLLHTGLLSPILCSPPPSFPSPPPEMRD